MRLGFTYNWNNKLDCRAFTTIRIFDPTQHIVGNPVEIFLKEESKGTGVIMDVRRFLLRDMNPFISYLDTGYSVEECQNIFLRMYKHIDFNMYKLALILIVKDKTPATGESGPTNS